MDLDADSDLVDLTRLASLLIRGVETGEGQYDDDDDECICGARHK